MARSHDIRTRRLTIKPFSENHLTEAYLSWLQNRELMRFSEQRHRSHTMQSCYDYWKSFEGTTNYFWAIEETINGYGHIGNINAYVDRNNMVSDLGILIGDKRASCQGYGLEAWLGVCHYLFLEEQIRKITAGMLSVNLPMRRLAHSTGMVDDGVRKQQCLCEDQEVDIVYKALFKEQWSVILSSKAATILMNDPSGMKR